MCQAVDFWAGCHMVEFQEEHGHVAALLRIN